MHVVEILLYNVLSRCKPDNSGVGSLSHFQEKYCSHSYGGFGCKIKVRLYRVFN